VRAREFITEWYRTRGVGDITFRYKEKDENDTEDSHLKIRQGERGVSSEERDQILNQVHMVRNIVLSLHPRQEFWLYDSQMDKAVGLRVVSAAGKIYHVGTVMNKKPWGRHGNPVIDVATRQVLDENTVSGAIATVAQPLGGMISRQLSAKPAKYSNGAPSLTKRKKTHARG
jgi:hypothetical protein